MTQRCYKCGSRIEYNNLCVEIETYQSEFDLTKLSNLVYVRLCISCYEIFHIKLMKIFKDMKIKNTKGLPRKFWIKKD